MQNIWVSEFRKPKYFAPIFSGLNLDILPQCTVLLQIIDRKCICICICKLTQNIWVSEFRKPKYCATVFCIGFILANRKLAQDILGVRISETQKFLKTFLLDWIYSS